MYVPLKSLFCGDGGFHGMNDAWFMEIIVLITYHQIITPVIENLVTYR